MFGSDVFVEYMIKRKKGAKDWALLLGAVVLAVVLVWLSFLAAVAVNFPIIPYFVIIACGYGLYWVWTQSSLEFEYSFTNGDITVDKIIAKRKRKRVVSFDAKNVELIGEVGENTVKAGSEVKTVYRTGVLASGQGGWYIVYSRDGGSSKSMLLFSPNEKFIQALKPFLPARVRLDAFGRN